MNSRARAHLAVVVLVTCLATVAWADEITLKGGVKLTGTVVSEDETTLVLKLHDGGKTTLQKKMIESIKRSEPQPEAPPETSSPKEARPAAAFPPLGRAKELEPGVLFHDLRLKGTRLWIYKPKKKAGRVPLVLIAPAGTRLVHGIGLAEGDRPEHLPYVRAGFCVVAYSLTGPVSENANDAQFIRAVRAFLSAKGGLANARLALEYALAKLPVDEDRVYAAGHSSAGVIALQWAGVEPRIKALAAFAPCTNIPKRMGLDWLQQLEAAGAKGVTAFARRMSPHALTARIKVPVFLLHAKDDSNVPLSESATFVRALKKTNTQVTFVPVDSGGHYQSMIDEGVPRAIRWFKSLR